MVGVVAQPCAKVADGAKAVAETLCDRLGLQTIEEVSPEGLVLKVGPGFGLTEEFGEVCRCNTRSLHARTTILHHRSRRKPESRGFTPDMLTDAKIRPKTSKMRAMHGWKEEAPTGAGAAPDVRTRTLT